MIRRFIPLNTLIKVLAGLTVLVLATYIASYVASLTVSTTIFDGLFFPHGKGGCEYTEIFQSISPDAGLTAIVRDEYCSDGGFVSVVYNTVHIIRSNETINDWNRIFVHDNHGPEKAVVQWLSPQKLRITVPNDWFDNDVRDSFDGVEIVVKYFPDDPVERRRILIERAERDRRYRETGQTSD